MSLAVGDAARQEDGTLGVLCNAYRSGNVRLLLEDGSTTGWIQPSTLARPGRSPMQHLLENPVTQSSSLGTKSFAELERLLSALDAPTVTGGGATVSGRATNSDGAYEASGYGAGQLALAGGGRPASMSSSNQGSGFAAFGGGTTRRGGETRWPWNRQHNP